MAGFTGAGIGDVVDTGDIFKSVCTGKRGVDPEVLEHTIVLAVELAREGRGGAQDRHAVRRG